MRSEQNFLLEIFRFQQRLPVPGVYGGIDEMTEVNAIQRFLGLKERNVIAAATSVVATQLLRKGRTAKSTFWFLMPCNDILTCGIDLNLIEGANLTFADLIEWNEIVMCMHNGAEAVKRTLEHVVRSNMNILWTQSCNFCLKLWKILLFIPCSFRACISASYIKRSSLFHVQKCYISHQIWVCSPSSKTLMSEEKR